MKRRTFREVSAHLDAAIDSMQQAWLGYKEDRCNARQLRRYVSRLRRCERLVRFLKTQTKAI